MSRTGFILRAIGALLLVALVAVGGFMAYRAGVTQGVAQAPVVATAIAKSAESGQVAPVPPMYGYGYAYPGYGFHHFGMFPIGGICFGIFFLFLFFGLLRFLFFRPWHREWRHHHGPWGRNWENGVPSMFDEWHKRAHGEKPADANEADKKE